MCQLFCALTLTFTLILLEFAFIFVIIIKSIQRRKGYENRIYENAWCWQ